MKHISLATKDSTLPKNECREVRELERFSELLTTNISSIGDTYLVIATHGVDMAVNPQSMIPEKLDDSGKYWWPECGLWVDFDHLNCAYAQSDSVHGAGILECDFNKTCRGFSIAYLPQSYREDIFDLITEAYMSRMTTEGALVASRQKQRPCFDSCPCCAARAARIRKNTESHPIYKIFSMYARGSQKCRFHIFAEHVDMLSEWRIDQVSAMHGEVFCTGDEHVFHIDASMIHTIQIVKTMKEGLPYSELKCYHSLGGVMLEFSLAGHHHSCAWHEICISGDSNYCSVPSK